MSIDFNQPAGTSITVHPEPQSPRSVPNFQKATREIDGEGVWGGDGFGFDDFIDMINPLQHIPVVSSIYRAVTGDEISPGARMVGGALLGGVTGVVASAANVMIEQATGGDIGENVIAMFEGSTTESRITNTASTTAIKAAGRSATKAYDKTHTLLESSARQASQMQVPQVQAPQGRALPEEGIADKGLDPLDFGSLVIPAPLPTSLSQDEDEKNKAVLDLFSNELSGMTRNYSQAKANEMMIEVAKEMKA